MEKISTAFNYGREPGTPGFGLAQGLRDISEVTDVLAAGFAKNPERRRQYQEKIATRNAERRQQLQTDLQLGLERMKVYGEAIKATRGQAPSVIQMMKLEAENLNKIGGEFGRPNIGDMTTNAIMSLAEIPPETRAYAPGTYLTQGGQIAGQIPETPTTFQRNVEALAGMGVTPTPEQLITGAGMGQPPGATVIEVPGEFGTTRIGQNVPAGQIGQFAGPPAGEGGKPLPREAQDTLTGAFASLSALRTMETNLDKTGIVRGAVSTLEALIGTDEGAIAFQTARQNLINQAQSIIKGIPSNFDVTNFQKTIAKITEATPVARAKLEFTRLVTEQLVRDTIGYYKFTGFRIPSGVIQQARQMGIDPDATPAWSGRGSATANAEALLERRAPAGEESARFVGMQGGVAVYRREDGTFFGVQGSAGNR